MLVARIGKPHGLRGEVTVQAHTDAPRQRFAPGSVLATRPDRGPLTVRSARLHQGVWLVAFEEAADRGAAEALRGTRLVVGPDETATDGRADAPADPDDVDDETESGWYPHELVGLPVRDRDGAAIGEVTQLLTRPAQDLLAVRLTDGRTGLVPFVQALVPVVQTDGDPAQRHVVVDAPDGLFDLP